MYINRKVHTTDVLFSSHIRTPTQSHTPIIAYRYTYKTIPGHIHVNTVDSIVHVCVCVCVDVRVYVGG